MFFASPGFNGKTAGQKCPSGLGVVVSKTGGLVEVFSDILLNMR